MASSNHTSIPDGYKRCSRGEKCVHPDGCILPFSGFKKNRSAKDGLSNQCKLCAAEYARRYFVEHSGEIKEKCRRYREENPDKEKARHRRYREENPEKAKASSRQYREKNAERIRKKSLERYYRNRAENPDKIREQQRRWRVENPDKVREKIQRWRVKNADKVREWSRERYHRWRVKNAEKARRNGRERLRRYRAENPGKMNSYAHTRRARKLALPATFTYAEWERAVEYFDGCCAYCGSRAGLWLIISQEHFIPLSDPASLGTTAMNMLPACAARKGAPAGIPCCNYSKGAKAPRVWLEQRFGKRKGREILKRIEAYFEWVREQDR